MNLFLYQLKQAYLSLQKKPMFSLSIITTMALTLGTLICIFTLTYIMLYKPLPYPEQEKLYYLEHQLISNEGKIDGRAFTYPNLMHLYNNQTLFNESALSYFDADILTSHESEPMIAISFVTPKWFELFAIKMAKGRTFEQTEQLNAYHPVAIISYDTWQKEFNGNENILNEKLVLGSTSYRIIGVTAESNIELSLSGPGYKTQIYAPWDFNPVSEKERKKWGNDDGSLTFVGKISEQALHTLTHKEINHHLTSLVSNNWQSNVSHHPFFKDWRINIQANTVMSEIIGNNHRSIWLLVISAVGLVIIASTNIANLFISRTIERKQDLAIQVAVGASKFQLFKTILAEIGLLLFIAIAIAQFIALAGFSILEYCLMDLLPRIDELSLNLFSTVLSISLLFLFTVAFTLICRKMINYHSLNSMLQSSGKGNAIQVSQSMRNILISSQIAIATVLIFINIILYKDAMALINQPLGYETENTVSAVLAMSNIEQSNKAQVMSELRTSLENSPRVQEVSQAMRPSAFRTLALMNDKDNHRYTASGKDIDQHYFSMIKQPIIEGDNFTEADIKDEANVIIINDVFAKTLAPNGSAIGTKFKNGAVVKGVVKSINIPGKIYSTPRFYYPTFLSRNMLLIKFEEGQTLSKIDLIKQMKSINKKLSLFSYLPLSYYKDQRLFSSTATAVTTVILTALTLLLSSIGLYGILNYSSQMRRAEIGTYMAIGAKGSDIIKLMLKDNFMPIVGGIILSIGILSMLYMSYSQNIATDLSLELLPILLITLGLISIVSILACYLPLRKYIYKPAIHALRGSE